jgi:hypothetical protein
MVENYMIKEKIENLVSAIASNQTVTAVGLSSNPLPQTGADGDIDLFVYCSQIPEVETRAGLYPASLIENGSLKKRVMLSKHWGDVDFISIDGIDTWIMYFTESEVTQDTLSIMEGSQFNRQNGYYPTGRLAMFKNMQILFEREPFLTNIQKELVVYPPKLKTAILAYAVSGMGDDEDLLRAVNRHDVLFFHVVIDAAIDNLLQLLYAMNEVLFPSRKRVEQITGTFKLAPSSLYERLCEIIRLGADADTLHAAYEKYSLLRDEARGLYNANCA